MRSRVDRKLLASKDEGTLTDANILIKKLIYLLSEKEFKDSAFIDE